jgi:hypothetical protein
LTATADAVPGAAATGSSRDEREDHLARPVPSRHPASSLAQHGSCLLDADGYVDVP